jgi:hypothetical protein
MWSHDGTDGSHLPPRRWSRATTRPRGGVGLQPPRRAPPGDVRRGCLHRRRTTRIRAGHPGGSNGHGPRGGPAELPGRSGPGDPSGRSWRSRDVVAVSSGGRPRDRSRNRRTSGRSRSSDAPSPGLGGPRGHGHGIVPSRRPGTDRRVTRAAVPSDVSSPGDAGAGSAPRQGPRPPRPGRWTVMPSEPLSAASLSARVEERPGRVTTASPSGTSGDPAGSFRPA